MSTPPTSADSTLTIELAGSSVMTRILYAALRPTVAPVLGALYGATGLGLPAAAETFLKLLGGAASPLALVVIGSLPAPADTGNAQHQGAGCGPAIASIPDPSLRAEFQRFDRTQSAKAAKICAMYRNSGDGVASR